MKIVFLTCFVWLSIINCDARGSLRRCSLLSYTCVSDHYQIGSDALITRISSKEECAEKCCNNHLCVGFDYFGKPWQQCQLSYSTRKEVPLTSYSLTGSVIIQCQRKVDGGYSDWSSYSECSISCGGGTKSRNRTCTKPTPAHDGNDCSKLGNSSETKSCNTQPCPVDGGYSDWSSYSECSVSCGAGTKSRNRSCTKPTPAHDGNSCSKLGKSLETTSCNTQPCPAKITAMRCNGQDEGCCTDSTPCDLGEGDCDKNSHCAGSLICGTDNCPWGDGDDCCMKKPTVDGGYSDWSSYSECSISCGGGTKSRNRTCTKPTPAHDGNDCSKLGNSSETKSCNTQPCPVDGGYSDWSSYSECSVSCGAGTKSRNRSCTKPTPAHDGNSCSKLGKSLETTSCNTQPCPGTVKCGSDINADVGILTSPNYPKNYGNNENCTTYITVSKGHVIKIVIEELDIEKSNDCMFDYLEISDGMDRVMGKYCGKRYNIRLTSKSNGVQIKFKSDTSVVKAGFLLKWNAYSDLPQKMLGVYTMTYGSPHEYTYTVTRNRVFASCCCGYSWLIRQSDQSNVFPTRDGWFKGVGINWRENYYFYFRLTKQGTLELHYFKKGYTAKYKSLPNYYGKPGKGIKRDYLKKTLGAYITSFGNKEFKLKYTVQRDRLFLGSECCNFVWMIVQSDQQVRFPSYAGWFKGVGANNRKGYYMYFRLNDKDQLEIQYFKPGFKYEYNGLPNYYGSTGIGKRI